MPERLNIGDLQTPLRPLLKKMAGSPYAFAPERTAELRELADSLGVSVNAYAGADGFYICATSKNKIEMGVPTLERIWAYTYAYVAFFPLIQKHGMGKYIDLSAEPDVADARALLLWAHQAETLGNRIPWPEHLPRPDKSNPADPHLHTANQFFLMMMGWILLHELAHITLGHVLKEHPPEVMIEQEYEADRWASTWILEKWKIYDPDVRLFLQRCTGIAFAISMLAGVELYGESSSPRTHPSVADRLLRFYDDFVGTNEIAKQRWLAPVSILHLHLMNSGKAVDLAKNYATVRDYIIDVRRFFPGSEAELVGIPSMK